jgi:tetratricopeptide (TPR) repeat protein
MSYRLGENGRAAEALVEAALTLAREAGDRSLEAVALNNLSALVAATVDRARALQFLDQAVAINRNAGNKELESISLSNIGFHLIDQGDSPPAQAPLELALALSRGRSGSGTRWEDLRASSPWGGLAERADDDTSRSSDTCGRSAGHGPAVWPHPP